MIKRPLFRREDFRLCEVPVPQGYPQSQTHSGIAFFKGDYYLTSSPYPNKHRTRWEMYYLIALRKLSFGLLNYVKDGEIYENPCLYRGVFFHKGDIPTKFEPIADNPLIKTPVSLNGLPAYNSDPDIYIENGVFYILNRTLFRTKKLSAGGYESKTCISILRGVLENGRFIINETKQVKEWNNPYTSPCLTRFNGKIVFCYMDSNSAIDSETFNGLFLQITDSVEDLTPDNKCFKKVKVNAGDMLPWHMSLFQTEGKLFTIIACVKRGDPTRKVWQMFGEFSTDLSELTIYSTPLTDFNSYRGSACVNDDGVFVLYSTTVWEKIKGSNSVDGRDIIVAHMPFTTLLNEIRNLR